MQFIKIFIVAAMSLYCSHVNAADVHGILMVVKGDVRVESLKTGKSEKAKVGFKVFPGDTILTGKDSRAKLVMIDKNVINISPDSKFVLEQYVYKPDEDQKSVTLNVMYGKIRSTVNQKYDGEQNTFRVKTSSAVAGVRGTDFVMSFNRTTKVSKVLTFEGRVEVGKGLDGAGKIMNPVFVNPGQFSVASANTPPSLPVQANVNEIKNMNMQTDADKAPDIKDRSPSNDFDSEGSDKKGPDGQFEPGKGPEGRSPDSMFEPGGGREPNGMMPNMMDMMGEDPMKDVATDVNNPRFDVNLLPPAPPVICPGGICLPPSINPEYFQGTTKLIINVQ